LLLFSFALSGFNYFRLENPLEELVKHRYERVFAPSDHLSITTCQAMQEQKDNDDRYDITELSVRHCKLRHQTTESLVAIASSSANATKRQAQVYTQREAALKSISERFVSYASRVLDSYDRTGLPAISPVPMFILMIFYVLLPRV
jgi:phosphoribosyl-AMP cyclohydrolase